MVLFTIGNHRLIFKGIFTCDNNRLRDVHIQFVIPHTQLFTISNSSAFSFGEIFTSLSTLDLVSWFRLFYILRIQYRQGHHQFALSLILPWLSTRSVIFTKAMRASSKNNPILIDSCSFAAFCHCNTNCLLNLDICQHPWTLLIWLFCWITRTNGCFLCCVRSILGISSTKRCCCFS